MQGQVLLPGSQGGKHGGVIITVKLEAKMSGRACQDIF